MDSYPTPTRIPDPTRTPGNQESSPGVEVEFIERGVRIYQEESTIPGENFYPSAVSGPGETLEFRLPPSEGVIMPALFIGFFEGKPGEKEPKNIDLYAMDGGPLVFGVVNLTKEKEEEDSSADPGENPRNILVSLASVYLRQEQGRPMLYQGPPLGQKDNYPDTYNITSREIVGGGMVSYVLAEYVEKVYKPMVFGVGHHNRYLLVVEERGGIIHYDLFHNMTDGFIEEMIKRGKNSVTA